VKDNAFAGVEVSGSHAQWNAQLLKRLDPQNARKKRDHAVVAGEAIARKRPARKGSEANRARNLFKVGAAEPTAIGRADQRAHTGSSHDPNRNSFFFENLQNTDVCDAAGKSAAQSHAQGWSCVWLLRDSSLTGKLPPKGLDRPDYLPQAFHRIPHFRPHLRQNS